MKLLLIVVAFLVPTLTFAQTGIIDSMQRELKVAKDPMKKLLLLANLSRSFMNIDINQADVYGKQMLEIAEVSRNRRWMFRALMNNGDRFKALAGRKEYIDRTISYFQQAADLARRNRLDSQLATANLALSDIHLFVPDLDKALSYCNSAASFAIMVKDDSLRALVEFQYGRINEQKDEMIAALRNFLNGLRIAEDKDHPVLMRAAYGHLSTFYNDADDIDRAIDYADKGLQMLARIPGSQTAYNRVEDYNKIGKLYAAKKNYDVAMTFYNKGLDLLDTLKFETLKVMMYQSILQDYMTSDQPRKGLDYFNSHPQMIDFMKAVHFDQFIDHTYGYMYAGLKMYDSALYFFNRAAPHFDKDVSIFSRYSFNLQVGQVYREMNNFPRALEYFNTAWLLSGEIGSLPLKSAVAEQLDSVYRKMGDYKQALYYTTLQYQFKDSLDKLGKAKDMLQLEIGDEQQRQARIDQQAVESKKKRDNIQYFAITIGITSLFILLVMMGMFKVSALTIKMIGFFAFLMFFEFIFLIFKKNIYSLTKGEPWRDLLFMICLAAILLPLHHWLEHKVIHYLTSHNRLTSTGTTFREKWANRKKPRGENKVM